MPESTTPLETDPGAYQQIHFAWAEPTLLGRIGPGPAATSLPQRDQPVLRSWRDRLVTALTADYRSALPGTDPADYPETLWAHHYPDGQSALVYRWPGDVRQAHAWAIVGPTRGLTLSRILALHENPNTRPAARRPPAPGWATMSGLPAPQPWERAAAPGAVRTRDRRAAETDIGGEPILVGALARALDRPDLPIHLVLEPDRADLWQAVQLRFLWGLHRTLYEVLTPPAAIAAAGWNWSFSTYDPVLGVEDGPHLAFGPPSTHTATGSPFLTPAPVDHLKVADGLVTLLREEGGDALAEHLRERGVSRAPTFADRRELLRDWFDPSPRPLPPPLAREPERVGSEHGLREAPDPFTEEEPPAEEAPEQPEEPPAAGEDFRRPEQPPAAGVDFRRPEETPAAETEIPETEDLPSTGSRTPTVTEEEAPSTPDFPSELGAPSNPLASGAPGPSDDLGSPEPPAPAGVPQTRSPADAPPLPVLAAAAEEEEPPDYAAETEPEPEEGHTDPDDNWPTQYADLPLARLEKWHAKRGPQGAHTDVVDARAAVRAERAELQRVRGERDRYHAEVQELRRQIARLDQPWIEAEPAAEGPARTRRWPRLLLVLVPAALAFAAGAQVGAATGLGVLGAIAALGSGLASAGWWPL